jgi:hypothetical protein
LFGGLKRLPSSALDGVFAHEVAHDLHQHSKKAGRLATVISFLTSIVGIFVGSDRTGREEVSAWAKNLTLPTYGREQELEADAAAVKILANAGYGAGASDIMRYALEWLRENLGDAGGGFLDNHPSVVERIERLNAFHAGESPWDEFRRALAATGHRPSVTRYLESHHDSDLGTLLVDGLSRVDDRTILERTALVAHLLDISPVAICSGVVSRDYGAVAAALNLAGSTSAKRLADLNGEALDSKIQELPEVVAGKEDAAAALDEITGRMGVDDGNRLRQSFKNGKHISMEDLCWASRALFTGIGRMRDKGAAARLARRVARYP